MRRVICQLVLGMLLGTAVRAESAVGPAVPQQGIAAEATSRTVESETKPLGVVERGPAGQGNRGKPGESAKSPAAALQGVVGPLALVLVLIAMLAGVAVLVARFRGKLGGVGGLSASFGAGGRAPAGILEVLGRYPLARGLTLVLLKVDRRVLLLSQTRTGRFGGLSLAPICELDSPEDVASILLKVREADSSSLTNKFASVFRSLDREAAEKVEHVEVMSTLAPTETPPGRAKAVTHRPSVGVARTESTGSEAAASIRRRLDALRVPGEQRVNGATP
ncbi:MAG: hypothetical protein JNM86_05885 [Phycisphaerae bacterium]|nr:hypothetical protein [Phycisphaerae bacterium]